MSFYKKLGDFGEKYVFLKMGPLSQFCTEELKELFSYMMY
jgi:hypothetical protein